MEITVLNGVSNRVGAMNGGMDSYLSASGYPMNSVSNRVAMNGVSNRVLNGCEPFDPARMDPQEYKEYLYECIVSGGVDAMPMQGLFSKWKERRQERKAGRELRRETRRGQRERRREQRTKDMEGGKGFFQRLGGAIEKFGSAREIDAIANQEMVRQGMIDPSPGMGFAETMLLEGAKVAGDAAGKSALEMFYEKNKTAILVGGGLTAAGIVALIVRSMRNNSGQKKRRR